MSTDLKIDTGLIHTCICINKNPICIKAFTSNCEYITGLVSLAFVGMSHENAICVKSYCARPDILCVILHILTYLTHGEQLSHRETLFVLRARAIVLVENQLN